MKELVNVTDIIEYLYCPRKVFLRRVKKIKTPPNKPMILGFLKHKVFDIFNKREEFIVSSILNNISKEDIVTIYKNNIKSIISLVMRDYHNQITAFSINPVELEQDVFKFLDKEITIRADSIKKALSSGLYGKNLWRDLTPKYLTEYEIVSENLGLKGRVDRIKFEEIPIPYEIKTREEVYESDKLQITAYILLLEEEFNKHLEKGFIETKSTLEEIKVTEEMKAKVLDIADKIRTMKDAQFQNNFNKCESCFLKKECFEE